MSRPILQAHCQSRTNQLADQSFVKELAKPPRRKIVLNNSQPFRKIKNATHKPRQKDNITNGQ